MADFRVEIDDRALREGLRALTDRVQDATPLMEDIARVLRNHTEDAFRAETSPFGDPWAALTDDTIKRREKDGHWPGSILQVSGQLAASLSTRAGPDFAEIGFAKIYAAIHQFGGLPDMAPGPAAVPARPSLPIDRAGNLPEAVRAELLDLVADYLRRSLPG